jgi:hypothetical protein
MKCQRRRDRNQDLFRNRFFRGSLGPRWDGFFQFGGEIVGNRFLLMVLYLILLLNISLKYLLNNIQRLRQSALI